MREVTINMSELLSSGSIRLRRLLGLFRISPELVHVIRHDDQEPSLPVLLDERGILTRVCGNHFGQLLYELVRQVAQGTPVVTANGT